MSAPCAEVMYYVGEIRHFYTASFLWGLLLGPAPLPLMFTPLLSGPSLPFYLFRLYDWSVSLDVWNTTTQLSRGGNISFLSIYLSGAAYGSLRVGGWCNNFAWSCTKLGTPFRPHSRNNLNEKKYEKSNWLVDTQSNFLIVSFQPDEDVVDVDILNSIGLWWFTSESEFNELSRVSNSPKTGFNWAPT